MLNYKTAILQKINFHFHKSILISPKQIWSGFFAVVVIDLVVFNEALFYHLLRNKR